MHTDLDAQLDRVLPSQFGAFSLIQTERIGFTERMRRTRIEQGTWVAEDRGVYRHSSYRPTWDQRCICALLSRPGSLLAERTSAAAHGLTGFRKGRIVLDVRPGASARSNLATIRRTDLRQPRRVRGLVAQSIPITLFELASSVTPAKLGLAVQDAIISGQLSAAELERLIVRLGGEHRRGIVPFRAMVDELITGEPIADSMLEAQLHQILSDPRIPPFVTQEPFPWNPKRPSRLDVYIEDWRMLIEGDGRRWHARFLTMDNDRARDRAAVRHGYLPLRFGWPDLQDPEEVRATIIDTAAAHRHLWLPGAA